MKQKQKSSLKGMIGYRRGVAGSVLQTALLLIEWFTDDLWNVATKNCWSLKTETWKK